MRKQLSYVGFAALLVCLSLVLYSKGVLGPKLESSAGRRGPAPKLGEDAPDFETMDDEGRTIKLSAFRGKQAVALVFYPKDDTSG